MTIGSGTQTLPGRIREFFLLEDAKRRSAALTESQLVMVRTYYKAGVARLAAANDLRGLNLEDASLALYREGALLLAFASLLTQQNKSDVISLRLTEAMAKVRASLEASNVEILPEFARTIPLLESLDPLRLDRMSNEERAKSVHDLDVTTSWLTSLIEARSPRGIRFASIARIATLIGTILAILAYATIRVLTPKNLALEKPVTGTATTYNTALQGAVDGEKNGTFGYCSIETDSPSLSIDLGQSYAVATVKVFGRGDCCYDQSVPLLLEFSEDGVAYHRVAERTESFSQNKPWVITQGPQPARFVRLTTQRHSFLVLGEVEVYGGAIK